MNPRSLFPALLPVVLPLLLCLSFPTTARAGDPGQYWELSLVPGALDYYLSVSPSGKQEAIWFWTFTLKNPGDEERPLRLALTLRTDAPGPNATGDGQAPLVYVAGKYPGIFEALRKQKKLLDYADATAWNENLAPGALRKGIAVFGPLSPEADEMIVIVEGLSQRVQRAPEKIKVETAEPAPVMFRVRQRHYTYRLPGDAAHRLEHAAVLDTTEWVLAGEERIR